MIYLLTSNILPIRSIREYNDNFIISLLHVVPFAPLTNGKMKYVYDIFHQSEMEMDDQYTNQTDIEFHLHPVATIEEALVSISQQIKGTEEMIQSRDEDSQEELVFGVCCDYAWNGQVVKYLNNLFGEMDNCEIQCLNLYTYLKIPSVEAMSRTLKNSLGTEFVYPEEPVAFGYALHTAIGGLL